MDVTSILPVDWKLPSGWEILNVSASVLLIIAAALVLTFVVRFALRRLNDRMQQLIGGDSGNRGEQGKRAATVIMLLRGGLLMGLWATALVMVLSELGLDITPVLAGVGILGLAVGFGAQNLVRDLIAGMFHILEDQIRVGDIALINGTGGVVERITYRIVVLRDLQQRAHVFSHGNITSLANMTKTRSAMVIDVGVAYKEHPDTVIAALRDVGESMMNDPDWQPKLIEPLEVLGLDSFGDSAVNFRVRYMTRPAEQWGVMREYQRRMKIEFDRRGIEFPFPHRTLYIAPGSAPLSVRRVPDDADTDQDTGV